MTTPVERIVVLLQAAQDIVSEQESFAADAAAELRFRAVSKLIDATIATVQLKELKKEG